MINKKVRKWIAGAMLMAISIVLTRVFSYMIPLAGIPALRFGFGTIPIVLAGMLLGPVVGGACGLFADIIGFMLNPMGGVYFPGFTLSSMLFGVIPGVIYLKPNHSRGMDILKRVFVALGLLIVTTGIWGYVLGGLGLIEVANGKVIFIKEGFKTTILIGFFVVEVAVLMIPFLIKSLGMDSFLGILFTVSITYIIVGLGLNTKWLSIMYDKGFMVFLPGRIVGNALSIPLDSFLITILYKQLKRFN